MKLLLMLCLLLAACTPTSAPSIQSSSQSSHAPYGASWRTFTKPAEQTLRTILTPLQFAVTQEEGTEHAYRNEFWEQHEDGIYVDIVSGEPLFSSKDKYDSNTGWPSFTKPLNPDAITTRTDTLLGISRTEVRSNIADSHLGHVFNDGPDPLGLRYCINSASLRFIPAADLSKEGYAEFEGLFQ